MKEVKIEAVSNGFIIILKEGTEERQYIYRAVDDVQMIRKVGEFLLERRIKVAEDTLLPPTKKEETKI